MRSCWTPISERSSILVAVVARFLQPKHGPLSWIQVICLEPSRLSSSLNRPTLSGLLGNLHAPAKALADFLTKSEAFSCVRVAIIWCSLLSFLEKVIPSGNPWRPSSDSAICSGYLCPEWSKKVTPPKFDAKDSRLHANRDLLRYNEDLWKRGRDFSRKFDLNEIR